MRKQIVHVKYKIKYVLVIFLIQGYYFHTENPFKECSSAFEEGMKKLKEGDLPVTILYLESAILQDPNDAEVANYT